MTVQAPTAAPPLPASAALVPGLAVKPAEPGMADDSRPGELFLLGEDDAESWWQNNRVATFCGALLIALVIHASALAGMVVTGLLNFKQQEPTHLPNVEVVHLGSVGDGYRAGRIGTTEGNATQPNLRNRLPAASGPSPQPSMPLPPTTQPQPSVPARPTQPKPVPAPTQPKPQPTLPKPEQTLPKPLATKPVEKPTAAEKKPVETVPLPPAPPPVKPKPTASAPTRPQPTPPKVTAPPAPHSSGPSATGRKDHSPPAATLPGNSNSTVDGGDSSKGDSTHNGSGRRRGTRGSGGEGDGVDPPTGFYNPTPPYPSAALTAGRQGRVVLWIRIRADGSVEWARVHQSSGDPEMDDSALLTVRRWRFNPARDRKTGQPVASEHLKNIDFVMRP